MTHIGERPLSVATTTVIAGRPPRRPGEPFSVGITPASALHAGGDNEYTRYGNPGWDAFESAIAELERGRWAVCYPSGMAAITALLDVVVSERGIVVAPHHAYFETLGFLRGWQSRGRIQLRSVDVTSTAAVLAAAKGADVVWLESPTNPTMELADISAICAGIPRGGPIVVVDNTTATPVLQQPLDMGADMVVHSATKHLGGHSDALMGVTVSNNEAVMNRLREERGLRGCTPGVLETFLVIRGVRTLALRVERAQDNARVIAERLRSHSAVTRVYYPGIGAMVSFEVDGSADDADNVCAQTEIWTNATSLGDVGSLLERRRRWTGESVDIPESLIRLSVGIEGADDLWDDLNRSLLRNCGTRLR